MDDLGDHGERGDRARADARHEQEVGEIARPAIRRRGEGAAQPPQEHVGRTDVVMIGHREMRKDVGRDRQRGGRGARPATPRAR